MKPYLTKPIGGQTTLRKLTRFRAWSIDLTLQCAAELPLAELTKTRPTTFGSILNTLAHIHIVDQIFKAHIEGRDHGYSERGTNTPPEIPQLQEAIENMDRWLIEIADQLAPTDLSRMICYQAVGGGKNSMSIEEIMLHLINHATYHIGYVSDMMYQVPIEPPTTDLTVFLRDIWRCDGEIILAEAR